MKTIKIKGKSYTPVNERLKSFRASKKMNEKTDQMISIEDRVVHCNDKEVIMEVTIKDHNNRVISRAHAHEYRDNSNINKTSFLENCSTSALGRALGYLGIGIDTEFASVDEMLGAVGSKKIDQNQSQEIQIQPSTTKTRKSVWLSEDQFNATMICENPKQVEAVIKKYSDPESGYKMKKLYKQELDQRLEILTK